MFLLHTILSKLVAIVPFPSRLVESRSDHSFKLEIEQSQGVDGEKLAERVSWGSLGEEIEPANITVPLNTQANHTWDFGLERTVFSSFANQSAAFYSLGNVVVEPLGSSLSSEPSLPNFLYDNLSSRGGTRNFIYGSARYGSGYGEIYVTVGGFPLWDAAAYNLSVISKSYPFGFWPISWGSSNYGGSNAFKDVKDYRPGGPQSVLIAALDEYSNKFSECYLIIADRATATGLNTILRLPTLTGGCGMYGGNPLYEFQPDELATNGSHVLQTVND